MATKREGCPCYDKAEDDEPIFTLLARDPLAADVVTFWIERAKEAGVRPEKIAEAVRCRDAMHAYPNKKAVD